MGTTAGKQHAEASERSPLLLTQTSDVPVVRRQHTDSCGRPVVDAMPLPVDAGQCATVLTVFAAKDLHETDRDGNVLCTNCFAPSAENRAGHTMTVVAWRCWNCNADQVPKPPPQRGPGRFCYLQ